MESGSTRVTLLTFAAPPDDGDAAPPHDHLVLVEDKWPILDRERGSLGQKKPYFDWYIRSDGDKNHRCKEDMAGWLRQEAGTTAEQLAVSSSATAGRVVLELGGWTGGWGR